MFTDNMKLSVRFALKYKKKRKSVWGGNRRNKMLVILVDGSRYVLQDTILCSFVENSF